MKFLDGAALTYDDISLVPQGSDIESRSFIDLKTKIGNLNLDLPIISSPMDTVTENEMVSCLSPLGALGIVHRYMSVSEQVTECMGHYRVGAAVGVTGDFLERAEELARNGVTIICVDVAHGHHSLVKSAISDLKRKLPDLHIMAGNIATNAGALDLCRWGADSIRVGIGGGSICSTRLETGHGVPNVTALLDAAGAVDQWNGDNGTAVKIVADGGIRNSGDIAKAIACGADFVMLGSMLAGTDEAPGELLRGRDGVVYKVYRGMASREAQHKWRGLSSSPEGISTMIPAKGPVDPILVNIKGRLESALSYTGARSLKEFQEKVIAVRQTNAGVQEAQTHILRI